MLPMIQTEGYDVVATATVREGGGPYNEVAVLNNNSTHFFVVMRADNEALTAQLHHTLKYGGESEANLQYAVALQAMVTLALRY